MLISVGRLRIFLLVLIVLATSGAVFAQTGREVSGVVRDTAGVGILGATVKLARMDGAADTIRTRTNINGEFSFQDIRASQFMLIVSSLGYNEVRIRSINTEGTGPIILRTPIVLRPGAIVLEQIVVDGTPPVTVKQDTIEYNAASFKMKENTVAEDLLKRVDGVEVDRAGNVTAQGKQVTRVRVNGKDYFGGDVKTATKNIPAKAIDKVQIIDDYGDQANFTGIRDGEPEKIINITTKPGTRGVIANATAGAGNDGRYQFSAFGNQLSGDRNIGFAGNLNNNNTQVGGFGFGGRGPSTVTMVNASGGSGGFGAGTGGGDVQVGGGLTTVGTFGLNYSDKWSKKLTVTAGYYFSSSDNETISNTFSQNVTGRGTLFSTADANRNARSQAHNVNARIQYAISPADQLIISPSVGFTTSAADQVRNNVQTGVVSQGQLTNTSSDMYTPSIGGNALYTHRFKKAGRNYSLNVGARRNGVDADDDNLNNLKYYDPVTGLLNKDSLDRRMNEIDNQTLLTALRFIHTEPLNKNSSLQFSYNANYNHYDNRRATRYSGSSAPAQLVDSLSNRFDYSFTSHQLGLNYSYRQQNNEFAIGLTANPAYLSGNSSKLTEEITRSNFYLAPILRYTHRYSSTRNIQLNYTSRAIEPTFAQLQPVRDVTDPQRQVIGNPNLNSSFIHTLNANYTSANTEKRSSFMLRLQGTLTADRVVTNTLLIPDAYGAYTREIRYLNADGVQSYSGNYNWQQSFADRQYTLRLNGNAGYNRNVSFADHIENIARESSIRQGLGMQINPGTWLEFAPNVSYRYTRINYTLETVTDLAIHTYTIDVDGNVFILPNRSLIWRFSGTKNFNSGYTGALNINPLVVNMSLEKAFLRDRSATLKLQAFDIFNQANNINRYLSDNGFSDIRTNRLTQYFLMSLTMRLNGLRNAPSAPGR